MKNFINRFVDLKFSELEFKNQVKLLKNEIGEIEIEKEKLSQEREKLSQEREKLSQEREKLSQEREKMSQEREKIIKGMEFDEGGKLKNITNITLAIVTCIYLYEICLFVINPKDVNPSDNIWSPLLLGVIMIAFYNIITINSTGNYQSIFQNKVKIKELKKKFNISCENDFISNKEEKNIISEKIDNYVKLLASSFILLVSSIVPLGSHASNHWNKIDIEGWSIVSGIDAGLITLGVILIIWGNIKVIHTIRLIR